MGRGHRGPGGGGLAVEEGVWEGGEEGERPADGARGDVGGGDEVLDGEPVGEGSGERPDQQDLALGHRTRVARVAGSGRTWPRGKWRGRARGPVGSFSPKL